MQFAKDSVYVALRDRLAAINPERVVEIDGVSRAAVLVPENQALNRQAEAVLVRNTFELQWGSAEIVAEARGPGRPLMKLQLQIAYNVTGADATGSDRGRTLSAMDSELLEMCTPRRTMKVDYSQATPVPLGSTVFWSDPQLGAAEEDAGIVRRTARVSVFYFPEVEVV
jgi:hypothetical protein